LEPRATRTNQQTGNAFGILMALDRIDGQAAFAKLLRKAPNDVNVKPQ
jgi:hypothetical protein